MNSPQAYNNLIIYIEVKWFKQIIIKVEKMIKMMMIILNK